MENPSWLFDMFKLLVAAALGLVGGYFGSRWKENQVRSSIFNGLQGFDAPFHMWAARARIFNDSDYPMTDCWAYITIDHTDEDIVPVTRKEGENRFINAHIPPQWPRDLKEDRLCWALLTPAGNPPNINIYSQEQQELLVFEVANDWSHFKVFSEEGHPGAAPSDSRRPLYRIGLRGNKKYRGYLKIVSKDSKGKRFFFEIDLSNRKRPLKILAPDEQERKWSCLSDSCRLKHLGDPA